MGPETLAVEHHWSKLLLDHKNRLLPGWLNYSRGHQDGCRLSSCICSNPDPHLESEGLCTERADALTIHPLVRTCTSRIEAVDGSWGAEGKSAALGTWADIFKLNFALCAYMQRDPTANIIRSSLARSAQHCHPVVTHSTGWQLLSGPNKQTNHWIKKKFQMNKCFTRTSRRCNRNNIQSHVLHI